MKPSIERSVVLITPGEASLRESGTGFVLAADDEFSFVVTCSHVIRDWPERGPGSPKDIKINGTQVLEVWDGAAEGVDLAVLKAPSLGLPALRTKAFPKAGDKVFGISYAHLYGTDYCRSRSDAKAGQQLTLQNRGFGRTVPAWEVVMPRGSAISRGNSGSPLFDARSNRVVGILSHARGEGQLGIALAPPAIDMIWERPDRPGSPTSSSWAPKQIRKVEIPEIETPVTNEDDLNENRFGGSPEHDGRRLSAIITEKKADYFYCDFEVTSTDGSKIEAPAVFHLHDTYARSKITIKVPDDERTIALRDVYSYGVYVVGCQVRDKDNKWITLELDLRTVAPRRFHDR